MLKIQQGEQVEMGLGSLRAGRVCPVVLGLVLAILLH